jgi:predicted RND superfamily exporter protein
MMSIWGLDLSLMGSITTSLITVIGIGTAIHVAVRFQEELAKDHLPLLAMERTLTEVVPAVFWTCATTAVGFGSLAVSRVAPVRDFGWLMAAASMYVGIAAFLLIPGGALLGRLSLAPKAVPAEKTLVGWLGGLGDWVVNHYFLASTMMFLVLALSLLGFRRLEVETDFTRNFRANSKILEGYRFVEDRMGGAGLVELAFEAPAKLTDADLARIRRCQKSLRELPGVTKVVGLTDMLDFLSPTVGRLSPFAKDLVSLQLGILRTAQPSETRQVWNPLRQRMRMLLRVREQQSTDEKSRLLESIQTTAEAHLGSSTVVTGLYVLLVHLIDSLLGDQLLSFLISSCLILGMTIVAFRSVRLGVVGFLPNLIPIAVVMGSMGWLGFRINVATAMIGSISMGLTVDYSIHYLSRFSEERAAGFDFFTALAHTNKSTGKAMFCANLALMLGFCVMMFSNFLPSMQFGMLISLAMLGGLIGNLVMLPILLKIAYWVHRPRPQTLTG